MGVPIFPHDTKIFHAKKKSGQIPGDSLHDEDFHPLNKNMAEANLLKGTSRYAIWPYDDEPCNPLIYTYLCNAHKVFMGMQCEGLACEGELSKIK